MLDEETFSLFQCNLFPKAKNLKVTPSERVTLKPVVNRTLFNVTIRKWVKAQRLLALSQRNLQDLIKYPTYYSNCAS